MKPRATTAGAVMMVAVALLVACAIVGLAACGNNAPVGQRDHAPADVINFPDGFANVAQKCDGHGHRVYSAGGTDKGVGLAVIADASCGPRQP